MDYRIQQTLVYKEDNILMAINGLTDEQEFAFANELYNTEYVYGDPYVRLNI